MRVEVVEPLILELLVLVVTEEVVTGPPMELESLVPLTLAVAVVEQVI
jgi:hypothetical protein